MILSRVTEAIINNYQNDVAIRNKLTLGQYFCSKYIKGSFPELFYCVDLSNCILLIDQWVKINCTSTGMPVELQHGVLH